LEKALKRKNSENFMGRCLVTGHTGFIGRVLTEKLLALGYSVIGYSTSTGQNILDINQLIEACSDVDYIYHLAAKVSFCKKDAQEIFVINTKGTANIFAAARAARHIKKIVFASTALVTGLTDSSNILMDETYFIGDPQTNPYVYSKCVAESICFQNPDIPSVIVMPSTTRAILSLVAPPGGCNIIDVHDVADGMIAAMENGQPGNKYLLTDLNITFRQLHKYAIPLPRWSRKIVRLFANPFLVDNAFLYKYYINAKARRELYWTPRRDPIKNFTNWWQKDMKKQTADVK